MIKRIIPVFLSFVFLAASIVYVSDNRRSTEDPLTESAAAEKPAEELRGVWVTYMTLDVENESDKEAAFKSRIDSIISDMKEANMNTIAVQVRPFSDSLYRSRYYPWSHILTGTQGEDPGYDPLEYIVKAAHENDIFVHAWVNPYRISTESTPAELSESNPYIKDGSIGVEVNGALYMNPASQKARDIITKGAAEIAEYYDIDGIQFDDYFYPPDCGDFDSEDYKEYCENTDSPLSLEEFRRDNVNKLISQVYKAVHDSKKEISFGISPQGNLSNNDTIYADVKKW